MTETLLKMALIPNHLNLKHTFRARSDCEDALVDVNLDWGFLN